MKEKEHKKLINYIVEQELVDKDCAREFCNQLYEALTKEFKANDKLIKERANALRPTTMAIGKDKSDSDNADYRAKQEELNKRFNSLKNNKQC